MLTNDSVLWKLFNIPFAWYYMNSVFQSLIQSSFGQRPHGNFEAVILEGNRLFHWWRDNSTYPYIWKRGQAVGIDDEAADPASIIQSSFRTADYGNFEVVLPLRTPNGRMELWHFWHDNSDVSLPWRRGQRISSNITGPASI